jgi:hypothetical protein
VRTLFVMLFLVVSLPTAAQTVVEMDLPSATRLLENHKMKQGVPFLERLANNYKKYNNIRVHSTWHEEAIASLWRALRTDFDGTGKDYIPELTIWSFEGSTGARVLLVASLLDKNAILLATDIGYLKGMIAFEILESVRRGSMSLPKAQRRALDAGIEMQVTEDAEGDQTISFFGHHAGPSQIIGKLIVIEPPDLVWN